MRLFAAVPIPEPGRGEIARLLARLREVGWPLRLVHDQGLHLTMKFFGEVPPGRLEVIEEAVRAAVPGTGSLPLRLAELGAFPTPRRPRIIAASSPAGPPPITNTDLRSALDAMISGCHPRRHSSPIVGFCVQRIGTPYPSWA